MSYEKQHAQHKTCLQVFTSSIALCLMAVLGMLASARAATECVNPAGSSGCFSTISAAVSAASPHDTIKVEPGTYKEFVTINKGLSLVGSGADKTIIDATGQSNAIYINNGSKLITGIVISGLTLENANYEGILVNGVSSATIWANHVMNNDKLLEPSPTNPVCPDLTTVYPFEMNEQDDCGEGIHLTNVDNSVVAYNTVENNSGGILVSDDTGPAHDNSIRNNIVINNVLDCGITLPSHTPAGVYHNTVSANEVSGNGTSPTNGGGAGVGLFSPGGPTKNFGNSIVGNILVDNGIGGVAMHTHAPGTETLRDEVITGNYIARNGPDSDLGLSGNQGDGISLLVVGGNVNGFVISDNTFEDEAEDIAISTNQSLLVTATLNNFSRGSMAIDNLGPAPGDSGTPLVTGNATVNATTKGCATFVNVVNSGQFASVVFATPWLANPIFEPSLARPSAP
jgi:hypothetical protein